MSWLFSLGSVPTQGGADVTRPRAGGPAGECVCSRSSVEVQRCGPGSARWLPSSEQAVGTQRLTEPAGHPRPWARLVFLSVSAGQTQTRVRPGPNAHCRLEARVNLAGSGSDHRILSRNLGRGGGGLFPASLSTGPVSAGASSQVRHKDTVVAGEQPPLTAMGSSGVGSQSPVLTQGHRGQQALRWVGTGRPELAVAGTPCTCSVPSPSLNLAGTGSGKKSKRLEPRRLRPAL